MLACVGLALGLFSLFVSPVPASAPAVAETTPTTLVAPYIMEMWQKVAWCEHHGDWHFVGSQYDGGLGIMPENWAAYAPQNFPSHAHLATPEQQVFVARRIQAAGGYPNYVPDQAGGCHAW